MTEWLAVFLGLIGFVPAAAEPRPEATVKPPIELTMPEMAGAERRFVSFDDRSAGIAVRRMIMRREDAFAIVDYRIWNGGYARADPWADHLPLLPTGAGGGTARSFAGGSGDLEWRFFPALAQGRDCIAVKRPVRLRHDPGNVVEVVAADVVAALCLRQGMLTERDAWRFAEAIEINDTGPSVASGIFRVAPRRLLRIQPFPPSPR